MRSPSSPPQPASYLSEADLDGLRNLQFVPRILVDGAYTGKHRSPLHGHAQEFTDYRDYQPGDEIRKIDWKVYGRTDRHIIKLSEQETVLTCHLMVDCSASMAFGGAAYQQAFGKEDISKFDFAARLAAALAYLLVQQGDRVGLTLFDSQVRAHVPAGGTYAHVHRLVHALEAIRPTWTTQISQVLREAYALMPRRGVLIVISDLMDQPDQLFEALDLYRFRNFEVILFQVLHRYELDLPDMTSVKFIDAESGDKLTSIPGDIRRSYRSHLQDFMDHISTIATARRIDYDLMTTATEPYAALEGYLERRNQRCRH